MLIISCKENPIVETEGSIQVKVLNSKDLKPISGVQLSTSPATNVVISNANGEYIFKNCTPGSFIVHAKKDGYYDNSATVTVTKGNTAVATIILYDFQSLNTAPDIPILKSPANNVKINVKSVKLVWSCKDANGDILKYDLYVGNTNPPTNLVASGVTDTVYNYNAPVDSTDYFWRIVAKDIYNATSDSEIRKFSIETRSSNSDLEKGLLAYWSFDDGTAKDQTGNGYDGTLMNQPVSVDGKKGKGMKFLGGHPLNDKGTHIILPKIPFNNFSEFSISLWVNDEVSSNEMGESYIFVGDHSDGGLYIMNSYLYPFNDNKLYLQFSVGSVFQDITSPKVIIYPFSTDFNQAYKNKWINYILTYKNGVISSFIDGTLAGTKTQSINIARDNAALGRHWWYSGASTSTNFKGIMDEVRIYSKALTQSEIDQLSN